MRETPLILVADDNPMNVDILRARLSAQRYEIVTAADGESALELARESKPDLLLLDVMMPKMDGLEVCRQIKAAADMPFTPIILVTAKSDSRDVIAGLDAGADEYLPKPVDQGALVARVRSMLRIKELHDQVQAQAAVLGEQADELASWNRTLEERVQTQLDELERISRLKRFVSPQIAQTIISKDAEAVLAVHRRQITVVFCDLRGFTAFADTAEPEEVMAVLQEYHSTVGELIHQFEGTVGHFAGDGLMVFFGDPIPCDDPSHRAVRMAVAMRERMGVQIGAWRRLGHELGFGIGIAMGYATLGQIGFEGRYDYGAIGAVVNLASRLCGEAADGQVLVNQRVHGVVEDLIQAEPVGELALKGLSRAVPAFNVLGLVQAPA
ncbi:MAG TPA: response regulator [Chloroflexota bacterium]|nr:response regulator [Chloroflexota bacterium]